MDGGVIGSCIRMSLPCFYLCFPCFICCQMESDGVGGIRSCYESEGRNNGWIIGPTDR